MIIALCVEALSSCKQTVVSWKQESALSWAVLTVEAGNLDPALMNFLTKYFPKEVKEKQKSNERASGIDRYGEDYDKCVVM